MNFIERMFLGNMPKFKAKTRAVTEEGKPIPAGRVSSDETLGNYMTSNYSIMPPRDYESFWRINDLDIANLQLFTPQELLDMLVDISPEISKAAWDFQRLCNPGYNVKVFEAGSTEKLSQRGTEHINAFLEKLRQQYGSMDVVIGRYYMGAFLRGGFAGELVLDPTGTESVDLVAPDPYSIRFRGKKDPERGNIWEPGQWQNGKFVSLDIPTFTYIPVDPVPGSPYGRSLAAPSLFTALFLLGVLHDIKRVVMQQGYKRMDLEVDVEMAMDAYSLDGTGFTSFREYLEASINEVKTVYRNLEPEDAFIHSSIFKFAQPAGTVDSDSIGAIDKVIIRLEKQITRALKSNGLILDTSDNLNEADSNRRWEIHAAGIKSLQHYCESMLEGMLNVSLRAKGIPATVQWRFSELRAAEMLRDEQTKMMQIQNATLMYNAGYASQNEASNYAVNHDADAPEPRVTTTDTTFVQDDNSGSEDLTKNTNSRGIAFSGKHDRIPSNGYNRN